MLHPSPPQAPRDGTTIAYGSRNANGSSPGPVMAPSFPLARTDSNDGRTAWKSCTVVAKVKGDRGILAAIQAAKLLRGLFGMSLDGVSFAHPNGSATGAKTAVNNKVRKFVVNKGTMLSANVQPPVRSAVASRSPFSPESVIVVHTLLEQQQQLQLHQQTLQDDDSRGDQNADVLRLQRQNDTLRLAREVENDRINHEARAAWAALARAAVGIPSDPLSSEYQQVQSLVEYSRPVSPIGADDAEKLLIMLSSERGSRVRILDLSSRLLRSDIPPPSTEALSKKISELRNRYPPVMTPEQVEASFCVMSAMGQVRAISLAAAAKKGGPAQKPAVPPPANTPQPGSTAAAADGEDDDEEDEEDDDQLHDEFEDEEDAQHDKRLKGKNGSRPHNKELEEHFHNIFGDTPYVDYEKAVAAVARYELDAVRHVLLTLSHTNATSTPLQRNLVHTVYLDNNKLAAPIVVKAAAPTSGGTVPSRPSVTPGTTVLDREPLRHIARLISINETLKVLSLRNNELGPKSVGVICKALKRNSTLHTLDLADNHIMGFRKGDTRYVEGSPVGALAATDDIDDDEANQYDGPAEPGDSESLMTADMLTGLAAIGDALKNNRGLRSLSLRNNGLHGGGPDDGAQPPEDDDGAGDFVVFLKETTAELEMRLAAEPNAKKRRLIKVTAKEHAKFLRGVNKEEVIMWQSDEGVWMEKPVRVVGKQALQDWEESPLWMFLSPLQHAHYVVSLDLAGNQLGSRGARMVANALSTNRSVRVLDVSDNSIGARGLFHIATLVIASPVTVLETLITRRNNLRGKPTNRKQQQSAMYAVQALAQAIQAKLLWCERSNAQRVHCESPGDVIGSGSPLRRLLLGGNHLGTALTTALLSTDLPVTKPVVNLTASDDDDVTGISPLLGLVELELETNEACGDHVSSFNGLAASLLHSLVVAQSEGETEAANNAANPRAGGGVPHLSDRLADSSSTGSAPDGLGIDSDRADQRKGIEHLNLSGNNLCAKGVQLLFSGNVTGRSVPAIDSLSLSQQPTYLRYLCSLRVLNLSRNGLGDEGVSALAAALVHIRTLRELDLSYNDLRATQDLCALLTSTRQSTSSSNGLRQIDLSHNTLCEEGGADDTAESAAPPTENAAAALPHFSRLVSIILTHPTLCNVDMSYNSLTPEHGAAIVSSLVGSCAATENRSADSALSLDFRDPEHPFNLDTVVEMMRWLENRKFIETFSVSAASEGVVDGVEYADQRPLWEAVRRAVYCNESITQLDCGLLVPASVASSGVNAAEWEEMLGTIRGRLLLNAMIKGPKAPVTS